jgi:hypothetical protein
MLSALIGVLGGAGLLGYLSEYATYNYAIHYGFRPPLEGIPYLRPAVAFGSLFLLLSCGLVFAFIAFALRSLVWYVDAIPKMAALPFRMLRIDVKQAEWKAGQQLTVVRQRSLWHHLAISLVFTTFALAAIALAVSARGEGHKLLLKPEPVAFVAIYILAIVFAVLRPNTIWWSAIIASATYFVVCVYLLFTPVKYSEFLRLLGYGGGISVRIELRDEKGESKVSSDVQQLMLRTTEAVILYDSDRNAYSEIPRDQIHRIVHDAGGMRRLPYVLPTRVHRWGDG